jgi:hypothetical protein
MSPITLILFKTDEKRNLIKYLHFYKHSKFTLNSIIFIYYLYKDIKTFEKLISYKFEIRLHFIQND